MRASLLLFAVVITLSASTLSDAQVPYDYYRAASGGRPGGCGNQGKPDKDPKCKDRPCGPKQGHCGGWWGCRPCSPYSWPCVPQTSRYDWTLAMYPPVYVNGAYDTNLYTYWHAGFGTRLPYYDTAPVQYAYTPIDIPPRAPVVRPERTSAFSRILPRQVRRPLYEQAISQ